jgi:hypothetical protein
MSGASVGEKTHVYRVFLLGNLNEKDHSQHIVDGRIM